MEALLDEIATWRPRISAVLRNDGLQQASVERIALRVESALNNTLKSADGLWILSAHREASTEYALTAWEETRRRVRLDRVFRAGEAPMMEGDDYLWIVDYKTTMHGREGIEEFLMLERERYNLQMETYAHVVQSTVALGKVRVGLYYPLLSRLTWWTPAADGLAGLTSTIH